jgi:hypothetical protein
MQLSYTPATKKGSLHKIIIDGESLETTRAKEVLAFAEKRIYSKMVWKQLKNAVWLGESLHASGGGLFY